MAEEGVPPEETLPVLTPSVVRTIDFYGDELLIALVEGVPYVAIRPFCEHMGLTWGSQYNRIQRDDVLPDHIRNVVMTSTRGQQRPMLCLELEMLPGWLFTITGSRAKPAVQPKIKRYRERCFKILWDAYQDELLAQHAIQVVPPAVEANTLALIQIRDTALAVAQLAEQQLALQEQAAQTHGMALSAQQSADLALQRLNRAAQVVGDLQRRVGAVEDLVTPHAFITEVQAAEISARVKALAELLTAQGSAKNHYQGIFSELYRRFGVSSYKAVRLDDYEAVLRFLDDWRAAALQQPKTE